MPNQPDPHNPDPKPEKTKRSPRKGKDETGQDLEIDRGEPGHVESAENVERDLPSRHKNERR